MSKEQASHHLMAIVRNLVVFWFNPGRPDKVLATPTGRGYIESVEGQRKPW
jgi:hypothetical protein